MVVHHINGLVQDCSNSSALAMELLQSCNKPLISYCRPRYDCNTTSTDVLSMDTFVCIWVISWRSGCHVTWFCYQLIAQPGTKATPHPWPDPYFDWSSFVICSTFHIISTWLLLFSFSCSIHGMYCRHRSWCYPRSIVSMHINECRLLQLLPLTESTAYNITICKDSIHHSRHGGLP